MARKNIVPAMEMIASQMPELHDRIKDHPLTIGVDANEANVAHRVGSNVYAFFLLQALYEMKLPHTFIIYLREQPRSDFPVPHERWQYRVIPFPALWTQIRLPWEVWTRGKHVDVFWSTGHYVSPFLWKKTVVSIMDLAYLTHPQFFRKRDLWQLRTWTQASVNASQKILTISQHTKNDIPQFYNYVPEHITVTYPGIDHKKYFFPQDDGHITRVKQHFGIEKNYILYVGTLQPRKNILKLIEAFALLKRTDYQLVIAGKKGWMYEEIFGYVRAMKLERSVIFTDFVDEDDLPALMAGARCLALVSLYEGFGIPVIEAQAVGTPAVVSGVSSLGEILGNGGICVDPYNADDIAQGLQKIIDLSSKQYADLVDICIENAHRFSWQQCAQGTVTVLEEVGYEKSLIV